MTLLATMAETVDRDYGVVVYGVLLILLGVLGVPVFYVLPLFFYFLWKVFLEGGI